MEDIAESKRVTLRPEDMTAQKISVIFQVQRESVFLTDDSNVALFPRPDGDFNSFDMISRAHYEVHGDPIVAEKPAMNPHAIDTPVRFSFNRPTLGSSSSTGGTLRASYSAPKTFVRNVFNAEIINGKLETSKMVTLRFTEPEACVTSILTKVKEALGQPGSLVLTDSHGNEILDSEGTRGSAFWKQNSRKVYAVPEEQVAALQGNKRKRLSRREDNGLQDVMFDIEEVVEAAQGLQEVSKMIKDLCGGAKSTLMMTLTLSEAEVASLKEVFTCLICNGPLVTPVFSTCCRSLIGCKECVETWNTSHEYCPKCRSVDLENNLHEVAGLSQALTPLKKMLN
ncbi:hypothetical protein WMY93_006125 [Mugilogobius chulae]|uniref:RING-type domain-containing protein n=1 Tax=Mugilogobius chulae TaxID=88201 RepID=A0AAW0PIR7_9GOBI